MTSEFLRPMIEDDLESVLSWRNHPDIRDYMYATHEITSKEHRKWFKGATQNSAIRLLIFEQDNIARGFLNLTIGRCPSVADWGFYVAPDSPKGTGRALGGCALCYVFQKLQLHKLCGEALSFNKRSIIFHEALGFRREGLLRDQHCAKGIFHDVVRFGLLASEWELSLEEQKRNE
jgi:UDP-4-amino-4,6-dideoxy-N-acetyl-beta-L-altrosamine N-acetyltransferase